MPSAAHAGLGFSVPSVGPGIGSGTAPAGRAYWGAWLAAPDDESGLADAEATLAGLVESGPALVAVHGGTRITRPLLTEHARLRYALPALLVDDDLDRDRATTAILSGRTDLVGGRAETVASWAVSA